MFCESDVREEKKEEIKKLVLTCSICGKGEIKVLPMCSSSMPALNEVIGSYNNPYIPRYGALCMNCGHVEYFVDFQEGEKRK